MCGISLIVNAQNNCVDESAIRDMTNKVVHRGPDDEGYYFGKNFAFGHRRLSIIDLSQAGHQPMKRDNYTLIYNGEIYNYIELIEELKSLGHIFKTHSDTEVIFPAYWEWGFDAFHKFNGMWAFIMYDATRQEIVLCRDRFGVKPLYYTTIGDMFLAASEIKQFTVFSNFKAKLNKGVAANFLSGGWLNYSEETFFEGVYALKPGHCMIYNLATHEREIYQWYDLKKRIHPVDDREGHAVEKLRHIFKNSVNIRMRADVQVGSCLSGGIDSSSIVSYIHRGHLANEKFATVTSCYTDRQYDEQEYSDVVTRQTGFISIKTFPDLNGLLDDNDFDKMIYHQEQPFNGASNYSEYNVFRSARENGIAVLLDGQGSDEYFYGYDEFFVSYIRSMIRTGKFREAWVNMRHKAALNNISVREQWKSFFVSAYWHRLSKFTKKIIGKSSLPWLSHKWRRIVSAKAIHFNAKNVKDLSLQQVMYSSIPFQLHSADRNSMSFSLEVREPFMDYRLIEYVCGLPDEYKIKKGYSKHILREAITELPDKVKFRNHKMGFVAPDEPWLIQNKENIRRELEDAIAHTDMFSPDLVNRFDRFTKGELGYEPIYFRAITMNRFCKVFNMQL